LDPYGNGLWAVDAYRVGVPWRQRVKLWRRAPRKQAGELSAGAPGVLDEADDKQPESCIRCAACDHAVASASDRIEVAGRHHHTCINPAGITYRIVCYRAAAGCAGHGSWSHEYSWFAGFAWQINVCARCQVHLGWAFGSDDKQFWGLIADRIVER